MNPPAAALDETQELQYNLALTVPGMPITTGAWPSRAEAARRRHPPLADLAYGTHPRARLDLFRATAPRGTFLFIHGGFWRARSKDEFSWIAEPFLDAGYSVALPSYPLCPQTPFAAIAPAIRAAFTHLYRALLSPAERARIVVSGHSAGGYLAADLLGVDWTAQGLPAAPFHGVLPVSGVFDLVPLLATSINADLQLTPEEAARLSLHRTPARFPAQIALAVGGAETEGFRQQSAAMAEGWRALDPVLITVPDANHFDILDALATPGMALHEAARALLDAGPA
ncbi:alpha/beta hydrolase [Ancylobacter sp. Lp-2]|uniref:alpha/beta hydrolase n=1 Tax=Ancylobacter sp. Lp-2 TaxID=2881339 RepID=UPI001E33EA12|nr:alpha/beta hydrolase [Ancylobacter sp. Lp-2]MCB4767378.1 alpha/beta hydrolase [Ancylobacter sp. Lp-2]